MSNIISIINTKNIELKTKLSEFKKMEKDFNKLESKVNISEVRFLDMFISKLKSIASKNKLDSSLISIELLKKERYSNELNIEIKYSGYSMEIEEGGYLSYLKDNICYDSDVLTIWYDYIHLFSSISSDLIKRGSIYKFLQTKYDKLVKIYKELKESKRHLIKEEENINLLKNDIEKLKIEKCINEVGLNWESLNSGGYLNKFGNITKVFISDICEKTYKCDVKGINFKSNSYYKTMEMHYDIYIKKNDLHNFILRNLDNVNKKFKRQYNINNVLL